MSRKVIKSVVTLHYDGEVIQQWAGFSTEDKIQESVQWICDRVHIKRKHWRERKVKTAEGHIARIFETDRDKKFQIVIGIHKDTK